MLRFGPPATLLLLWAAGCATPPEDARFAHCADSEAVLYLEGSGELAELSFTGDTPKAEVLSAGDVVRAARLSDPSTFAIEAYIADSPLLPIATGRYSSSDATLVELRVHLAQDNRHFEGEGFFDLADDRPDWLVAFSLTDPREGYASEAIQRVGTLDGCAVAQWPGARPPAPKPEGL